MRFRDKKGSNVFDDIDVARRVFCSQTDFCENCPIGCVKFACNNPAEAARLMGYEVIDDSSSDSSTDIPTTLDDTPTGSGDGTTEEDDMDMKDKPLSEWTLGEAKEFCGKRTESEDWEGLGAECEECPLNVVCALTADEWTLGEKWSEKEAALIELLEPAYITRDNEKGHPIAVFWSEEPTLNHNNWCGGGEIAGIGLPLFKAVREGQCVKVTKQGQGVMKDEDI